MSAEVQVKLDELGAVDKAMVRLTIALGLVIAWQEVQLLRSMRPGESLRGTAAWRMSRAWWSISNTASRLAKRSEERYLRETGYR